MDRPALGPALAASATMTAPAATPPAAAPVPAPPAAPPPEAPTAPAPVAPPEAPEPPWAAAMGPDGGALEERLPPGEADVAPLRAFGDGWSLRTLAGARRGAARCGTGVGRSMARLVSCSADMAWYMSKPMEEMNLYVR